MAKRKRSTVVMDASTVSNGAPSLVSANMLPVAAAAAPNRKSSNRKLTKSAIDANLDTNSQVLDGSQALRASPDAEGSDDEFKVELAAPSKNVQKGASTKAVSKAIRSPSDSSLSDLSDVETRATSVTGGEAPKPAATKKLAKEALDPESDVDEPADEEELQAALSRKPPVDSDYLPLPWKGRLGYACLNTYLRAANPPVFSSRTCRIASILEFRHPLTDPSLPHHATKNRPDKTQPASIERGQRYVESLGLANARDIPKMLRWNDKYGIKFMRLSSEIFPFASHDEYGYNLEPFASGVLAEAGRVAAELGHRLTTHPGQFTQLGSPRKSVIDASFRDLEYHAEMLRLLKLPEQSNRDAVMILHMGGIFGDKQETLARFRGNYQKLSQDVKNRLVLENDDMGWSVHDLLPICEELNIPLVLDYHHHNIVFDETQIEEGTLGIMNLYDRIAATWKKKGITQKMHYSEPTPSAITPRQRRKHSPRVKTLPPCPSNMDLMIEAKDKEQAVFELMRIFKLPGWNLFNDISPYVRHDENRPWKPPPKKKAKKKSKPDPDAIKVEEPEPEPQPPPIVPDEEINMGGPESRVYWPPGMEEWLRPKKREIKKKDPASASAPAKKSIKKEATVKDEDETGEIRSAASTPASKSTKGNRAGKPAVPASKKRKAIKAKPTPSVSEDEMEDASDMPDLDSADEEPRGTKGWTSTKPAALSRRQSGRAKKAVKTYADNDESNIE